MGVSLHPVGLPAPTPDTQKEGDTMPAITPVDGESTRPHAAVPADLTVMTEGVLLSHAAWDGLLDTLKVLAAANEELLLTVANLMAGAARSEGAGGGPTRHSDRTRDAYDLRALREFL
jgi:hypothetical protein